MPDESAVSLWGHRHVFLPAMLVWDASFVLPMLMWNAVDNDNSVDYRFATAVTVDCSNT